MTVLRSSGHSTRHGVVGWYVVGVDSRPLLRGGPWRGGGRLKPSGSVDAYSLVDDLGRRCVHAYIVVVPFLALREIAVHILEQVGLLWVECGPFNCLPVLDLGAAVFNWLGGGLRRSTAVFGQQREGNGWVFGVPCSSVESPFRCGVWSPRDCGLASAEACSKCVCSHRCCPGVAWAVGVW